MIILSVFTRFAAYQARVIHRILEGDLREDITLLDAATNLSTHLTEAERARFFSGLITLVKDCVPDLLKPIGRSFLLNRGTVETIINNNVR